ncbi:MAG TPA: DUF4173 domain-containing protein [Kineosporiaceae bacterium]|nr:DUF4173 domain-containing protein [Kineosporiaceae bacterium]
MTSTPPPDAAPGPYAVPPVGGQPPPAPGGSTAVAPRPWLWPEVPGVVAPVAGPPLPPLADVPSPQGPVPRRLLATALAVGAAAALLLQAPRPGLGVPLVALAASGALWAVPGRRPDRATLAIAGLAVALSGVAALRASEWLVALCLVTAAVLAALVLTRARTWPALLLAGPAFGLHLARAVPWVGRAVRGAPRPAGLGGWGRGAATGAGVAVVVAGLLASADEAYARVFTALALPDLDGLVRRVVLGVLAALAVLTAGAATTAPTRWRFPRPGRAAGHRAEWALPLVSVAATLLLWVVVQAATLFGQRNPLTTPDGDTYAARARQGFGQLLVVTLILLALLTWASRRADEHGRRLLAVLGGVLVALGLVLVASALQRMWHYDQAYGWTVLRLVVAATELWLGLVLVGCAVAWLVRRTGLLARAVPVAAAAGLLVLALAGPDALVAQWNVDRYERTGRIDVDYLASLSDDAVPAMGRLSGVLRDCVLAQHGPVPVDDPWYGWNLGRSRAAAVPGVLLGSAARTVYADGVWAPDGPCGQLPTPEAP